MWNIKNYKLTCSKSVEDFISSTISVGICNSGGATNTNLMLLYNFNNFTNECTVRLKYWKLILKNYHSKSWIIS
jgi:hypothetical protein